ncbi:hypothetical protein LG315_10485 [Microbacterium marinum]|uniref:hypothetical protein n=1 Tax=Microbacterium marinum TaxID=421115 RepID=UPI0038511333
MSETELAFTDPRDAARGLEQLLASAASAGLDLLSADALPLLAEALLDLGDDDQFDVLHDYVHFRVDTSDDPAWRVAHRELEDLLDDDDDLPDAIVDAIEADERMPLDQRAAALRSTPIIAGIAPFLDWIGTGRPVTSTGALRVADIGSAAAFIGVAAVGVRSMPSTGDDYRGGAVLTGGQWHTQSMWGLRPLVNWWQALLAADVIETTATRVRAGSAANDVTSVTDATTAAIEAWEGVIAAYVVEVLTEQLEHHSGAWSDAMLRLTLALAAAALDPDAGAADADPRDDIEAQMLPAAEDIVRRLVTAGILVEEEGTFRTVPGIGGAYARGLMHAMAVVADVVPAEERADDNPFDDPDIRELMAQNGVVHRPGMAAELLDELKPLLREDGVDLDDPTSIDIAELQSAFGRAVERHNLELFTPVGEQRDMALAVLRLLTEAYDDGRDELARVIIGGIGPEPRGTLPAVAQVIGVALGVVDAWRGHGQETVVPAAGRAAAASARDVLAKRGRAFDSLQELTIRHRGEALLEGSALAVAAIVGASRVDGESIADAARRVLSTDR